MAKSIKQVRARKFVGKDFDSLKSSLNEYWKTYYDATLKDRSENGVGGLFLDLASYVGDNLMFYLDHQYNELDPETAVETKSIERMLKTAGVPIQGASPATVEETFSYVVPATYTNGQYSPREDALGIIESGTIVKSDSGINFVLAEDIDFREVTDDGRLKASVRIGQTNSDGTPKNFVVSRKSTMLSGQITSEEITVGSTFVPFRRISLVEKDITEIVSVTDALGNKYYEVGHLTQDVVFRAMPNVSSDSEQVKDVLKIVPAPYRFTKTVDLSTRVTTLIFGGGEAGTLEDDVIPDPSEFALALPYRRNFTRTSIDPQSLLQTKTLGVAALNTTLTITYRYGGGLSHNSEAGTVRSVSQLRMNFPRNPPFSVAALVRSSVEATNERRADGGEDQLTIEELRALIPAYKNSQNRVVIREDLLARIYTLPSNFGRVFRASVHSNPTNPLATQLYIISRNGNNLTVSPDTLKKNIRTYINPYRMMVDAIDILDASVINVRVVFEVVVDSSLNRQLVVQDVIKTIKDNFQIKNFAIDQPIILSDLVTRIGLMDGIVSIKKLVIENVSGFYDGRQYSNVMFDVDAYEKNGIISPPAGGIFELKYPNFDIVGRAVLNADTSYSKR